MKEYYIFKTGTGTKQFPLHQHNYWDIMYYVHGTGYLDADSKKIPFKEGDIIIVPPHTPHGSVSDDVFVNISIGGNFGHVFMTTETLILHDSPSKDGMRLSSLIFDNRHGNHEYIDVLCNAYAQYLLQNAKHQKDIHRAVQRILTQISENFSNPHFTVGTCLEESGYAKDYIRAEFKKNTALSPVQFLNKTRLEHAAKLLEIYGKTVSVSEIGLMCGFDDAIYFSKRFKEFTGISPHAYRQKQNT